MLAAAVMPREPNGRQRRLARDEEARVTFVAAQPHRRGERSNAGATPWQRALRSGLIRDPLRHFDAWQFEQAGLAFEESRADYRRAKGLPTPWLSAGPASSGQPMLATLRQRYVETYRKALVALRTAGRHPLEAWLSVLDAHPEDDERVWPKSTLRGVGFALAALARHFKV